MPGSLETALRVSRYLAPLVATLCESTSNTMAPCLWTPPTKSLSSWSLSLPISILEVSRIAISSLIIF